jgi:hypothetical protein
MLTKFETVEKGGHGETIIHEAKSLIGQTVFSSQEGDEIFYGNV